MGGRGEDAEAGTVRAALQLEGHEQVRQLRPAVGAQLRLTPAPIRIADVRAAHEQVRERGDIDHTGPLAWQQLR